MTTSGITPITAPPLWEPASSAPETCQLGAFWRHIETRYNKNFNGYQELHRWSVTEAASLWSELWDYTGVVAEHKGASILQGGERFDSASWFPEARLNFAENLLRFNDNQTALVGVLEDGTRRTLTYAQLRHDVAAFASALRGLGVTSGDVVAGFMPNVVETVIAMLATTSIGASWTSCSPDFGLNGVLDRFGQVNPKVLISADRYCYNGKIIDCMERTAALVASISSIKHWVLATPSDNSVTDADKALAAPSDESSRAQYLRFSQLLNQHRGAELIFESLPFNHPLYVMYSSGTTGQPKCIVHGAGGTLLQHLKEHRLHTDLRREDVLFYFTTCGWMMWNWLVSGLASGATLVLYDGSPFAQDGEVLLDLLEQEEISVFGVGAKYIDALEKAGKKPCEHRNLSALRAVLSTGSPLSRHSFEWVYSAFKKDLMLSSISGGTDILSCFVLGNPLLPVYAGEIQCLGLGMNVAFWDPSGRPLIEEKGELVCTTPFPSAPIGFWNDPAGERYRRAYFDRFENVWAHGDFGEITRRGTVIIHGRSDAVLNPGGVRIGTAEIYRQVESVSEILDSVVVGQKWGDDERVVLFVVLREGYVLNDELTAKIRQVIRANTTPRHVPAVIKAVVDIPRTISGKISEIAVKNVIHGLTVDNTDALANPEALKYFEGFEA